MALTGNDKSNASSARHANGEQAIDPVTMSDAQMY
jgi:hypothetical protein